MRQHVTKLVTHHGKEYKIASHEKLVRLGLVDVLSKTKPPVIEFSNNEWKIWTAYNPKMTLGTFITLHHNGEMTKTTIHPDFTISKQPL